MRAEEFLIETPVDFKKFLGIDVTIDSHFEERLKHNRMGRLLGDREEVMKVVDKIPTLKRQIKRIPIGHKFWIYDQGLDIALGMQKHMHSNESTRIQLNTVLSEPPWDGPNPIIEIPSDI